jgi:hypothetical protein
MPLRNFLVMNMYNNKIPPIACKKPISQFILKLLKKIELGLFVGIIERISV